MKRIPSVNRIALQIPSWKRSYLRIEWRFQTREREDRMAWIGAGYGIRGLAKLNAFSLVYSWLVRHTFSLLRNSSDQRWTSPPPPKKGEEEKEKLIRTVHAYVHFARVYSSIRTGNPDGIMRSRSRGRVLFTPKQRNADSGNSISREIESISRYDRLLFGFTLPEDYTGLFVELFLAIGWWFSVERDCRYKIVGICIKS